MKKLFLLQKSLFIAFAAATCGLFSIIGCAVQKPAAGRQGEAAGGEIRHAQASKALEEAIDVPRDMADEDVPERFRAIRRELKTIPQV